jgi:hypothetical protein
MDAGIQDDLKIVGEDVWLTVPPFSEYLRTVRLVAADAAVRAGLDYDEVEDFRIAVDELCHLLMSSTDHEISVSFGVVGHSVLARGRARRRSGSPLATLNEFSRTIIDSVSDHHELTERDDELGFAVMKETRSGPEGWGDRQAER